MERSCWCDGGDDTFRIQDSKVDLNVFNNNHAAVYECRSITCEGCEKSLCTLTTH